MYEFIYIYIYIYIYNKSMQISGIQIIIAYLKLVYLQKKRKF